MIKTRKTNQRKYMTLEEHRKKLMRDPEFAEAWYESQPEFAIIEAILKARIKEGITQKELAKKMKTKQSAISRLESGYANPSLSFLQRLAKALNSRLEIRFLPR